MYEDVGLGRVDYLLFDVSTVSARCVVASGLVGSDVGWLAGMAH